MNQIFDFYQYGIFFYSAVITLAYVGLVILGYFNINNKKTSILMEMIVSSIVFQKKLPVFL